MTASVFTRLLGPLGVSLEMLVAVLDMAGDIWDGAEPTGGCWVDFMLCKGGHCSERHSREQ